MVTAIFDISNMFYRSMFIVGGFGPNSYTYEKEFELDQLMRKITIDIAYTIRQLGPSRVILTVDSGAWRKKIEIEENEGYKGNREKSTRINWDNIYRTMNEFVSIMGNKGFIVSKIFTAEADDLMALWMDKLVFQKNEHIIFVSGDEDIRQLVKFNPSNTDMSFSTVFNPFTYKRGMNKKLYIPQKFEDWLNKDDDGINDIFNTSMNPIKATYLKILKNGLVDLVLIDGEDIALKKIFCGDDGDNIPAIYTWMATTAKGDEVQRRITEVKYRKIKEKLKFQNYIDLSDHVDAIYEEIAVIAKHKPPINMAERLKRQIKLVVLSKDIFPDEITEKFDEVSDDGLDELQEKIMGATMTSLLEGTRYISETNKARGNESDIFKEMDRISQQLF